MNPLDGPKFLKGQLVVVEELVGFWNLCHPLEKSREAIGQVCEVLSFRKKRTKSFSVNNVILPSSYYQYAVRTPSGCVYAFNELFLRELTERERKVKKMVDNLPELDGLF